MSPNQDEIGLSLPKACSLMIKLARSTLLFNLSLSRGIEKVQTSAVQTFADVFVYNVRKDSSIYVINSFNQITL